MKKLLLSLQILVIAFGAMKLALASDSTTIRVSCTIPEIPGVNTPLLKEQQTTANTTPYIKSDPQQYTNNAPVAFQKDTTEIRMINGHAAQLEVRTIYSR
jgi:hypothetical protein